MGFLISHRSVPVKGIHGSDSLVTIFKMHEGIILYFLDTIDFAVSLKRFTELLFRQRGRQVPNVQHFHLLERKKVLSS